MRCHQLAQPKVHLRPLHSGVIDNQNVPCDRGGRLELGVAGSPESHRLTATLSGTGGEQPKRVTLTVARHTDRLSIWPADGDTSEPAMLQIRQPESVGMTLFSISGQHSAVSGSLSGSFH